MGVPVITLAGEVHRSRVGVSILTNIGLCNLIAATSEDYVKIAFDVAADARLLADLRAGMRQRMRQSALMDAETFTRDWETICRSAWRRWCDEEAPSSGGATENFGY
jgi:predicted O-linked N-acetylglucosamine transferase (SPINDLY family)